MNAKWQICPGCGGEGKCVNPNIDDRGITGSEMAELGPDFAEEYWHGGFDQTCKACGGSGKITEKRAVELSDNADARREAAMENGDWDTYAGAGDYRHG